MKLQFTTKLLFPLALMMVVVLTFSACASSPESPYEPAADYTYGYEPGAEESSRTGLPHGYLAVGFIEYISDNFSGRSPFTYREKEMAMWIIDELLAMGHSTENIEVQEFSYWELIEFGVDGFTPVNWNTVASELILGNGRDYQLREDRGSQNVILTLPGQSERKIIVGAHYDSVPYPGASDNASGVALLLESAERMLEAEHYHTIVYVFFGAEEVGLFGAFYYYESLTPEEHDNVVMMINADVLIEGPYVIYGAGTVPEIDENMYEVLVDAVVYSIVEGFIEDLVRDGEVLDDWLAILEDWAIELTEHFEERHIATIFQSFDLGILETEVSDTSLRVDALATELSETHGVNLLAVPEGIAFPSDNLVFMASHTVVNLVGLERVENIDGVRVPMGPQLNPEFATTVLHSPYDEFNKIEYLWPGMMLANMSSFGLFLEAILTTSFH